MYVIRFMVMDKEGRLVCPPGSDYTWQIKDLKTLKGAKNRLLQPKAYIPPDTDYVYVFWADNLFITKQWNCVSQIPMWRLKERRKRNERY